MNVRRWLPLLAVLVAIVGVAVLRGPGDDGAPLDPRSTGPLGARGLVLLLEEHGATVAIDDEPVPGAVALLLADDLGEEQSEDIGEWVDHGGTLVVADPFSPFAPALARDDAGDPFAEPVEDADRYEPGCEFAPVRSVGTITVPSPALLRFREDDVACFRRGRGAYLVARAKGEGTIVALGGGGPFVNELLAEEGNAAMAIGLLAPREGASVVVLEPAAAGSGRRTLLDLVSQDVSSALWQLGIAFLVVVLWRSRRLGRPVVESDPVDAAGSELVLAVGNLLQHAKRRDAAAEMLRLQARRDLTEQLGLPVDAPVERIADVAASVGHVERDRVLSMLVPSPVLDDDALVGLANAVESLRREVTHV